MENWYNLIDEPWIPVVDRGRVSLRHIFSDHNLRALGGNPVQKIALLKLLLAIAQAAATPKNDEEWKALGEHGLAEKCLTYLDSVYDKFYLFGAEPFLQMPDIKAAEVKSYGAVMPDIATGNTTVLTQTQVEKPLDNADKALLLVSLMGFALGGKKTDNSITLTAGYPGKRNDKGKPSTSKPGPSVAHMGLLHNVLMGETLLKTLFLNVLTHEQVVRSSQFPLGVGKAPWEQMPKGEDDDIARELKQTLMGRLIPLCRFCLLTQDGLHYSEGIAHLGYKEGLCDPTVAIDYSGKDPKALWTNPDKRPWRELTSLLSFIGQEKTKGYECLQLKAGIQRVQAQSDANNEAILFAIWSGGLRVSSNAGEQYVSGTDDALESQFWLFSDALGTWSFEQLKQEMAQLEGMAKTLYGCVMAYYKEQLVEGSDMAAQASQLFWQLCEREFQTLLNHLDQTETSQKRRAQLKAQFIRNLQQAYDQVCPKETARQLDAWAACRPNTQKSLAKETP